MNYLLEGGATSNLSQVRGINLLRLALLNDKKDGNGVEHIMYDVLIVEGSDRNVEVLRCLNERYYRDIYVTYPRIHGNDVELVQRLLTYLGYRDAGEID